MNHDAGTPGTLGTPPTLPREIAPGVFWMSGCSKVLVDDEILHSHSSFFLVRGDHSTTLIDAGYSRDWPEVQPQILQVLDGRKLDFIIPTHPEIPHMGNVPVLLELFPDALVMGDIRNYHLYFPQYIDRLRMMTAGEEIDLGGRRIVLVDAILHDLPNTLWAYDTGAKVLFACDAYCFTHEHQAGECALTSEELPYQIDVTHTKFVLERGLSFTRHVDPEGYCRAMDKLLDDHPVEIIAPTHGGVITSPRVVTEIFKDGLRSIRGVQ